MNKLTDTSSLSADKVLNDLRTKSYTSVSFPLSHAELEDAVHTFFNFLTLPQEEKNVLCGKRPTDAVSDVGYIRTKGDKDTEIGFKDHKEYFHYHPDAEEMFATAAQRDVRVRTFFDAASMVYVRAGETVQEVVRTLEPEFPGLYEMFFPEARPPERILRFLKYDSRGLGKFLARAHYDRGGCTLALAESAPGLRIGKNDDDLTLVVHQDKTALFMPAFHFPELTGGQIPGAWHDVVQASEDTFSEATARWALVYFVNAPGLAFPSTKAVHVPVM